MRREAGLVEARSIRPPPLRDRILVVGGSPETLTLLRLASVRSDDILLVAEAMDPAVRRFVETFAVEFRLGVPSVDDFSGVNAALVALDEPRHANRAVQQARRAGVPVHVAGRPLVSDFALIEMVERRPASFPPGLWPDGATLDRRAGSRAA